VVWKNANHANEKMVFVWMSKVRKIKVLSHLRGKSRKPTLFCRDPASIAIEGLSNEWFFFFLDLDGQKRRAMDVFIRYNQRGHLHFD